MIAPDGRWLSSKSQPILCLLHLQNMISKLQCLSPSNYRNGKEHARDGAGGRLMGQFQRWHTSLQLTFDGLELSHPPASNCKGDWEKLPS